MTGPALPAGGLVRGFRSAAKRAGGGLEDPSGASLVCSPVLTAATAVGESRTQLERGH